MSLQIDPDGDIRGRTTEISILWKCSRDWVELRQWYLPSIIPSNHPVGLIQANFLMLVVIAIEIGEIYSRVGAPVNGSMEVLAVDGQLYIPNYVTYTDHGILVGQEAKDQSQANPSNTIFDIRYVHSSQICNDSQTKFPPRRIIGRRFSTDLSLQSDIDSLPYDVVIRDDKLTIKVHTNGKDKFITPEEVQAEVLKKLVITASGYYGEKVTSAIVTVPAYFDDNQRQAIKDSGLIASLNVLRLVNEPTAAAIAHRLGLHGGSNYFNEEFVVVYNLGENHVDITVSSIEEGIYEILGTASDRSIGGKRFDDALLDYVTSEFERSGKIGILDRDPDHFQLGLKEKFGRAEETLSAKTSATIDVEGTPFTITLEQLQSLHKSIFDQSVRHVEVLLKKAKLQKTDISHIILTGNPIQVAKVQPFFEAFFDGKKAHSIVPSDEAALRGAATQAEIFMGDSGSDWVGAFDVSVLSLGIETNGGLFQVLIPRNTVMPKRTAINFTTINDNQSKIVLNIFEGQRPFVADNKLVGSFNITDLPSRPAGEVIVEVAFDLDANGILKVIAGEAESGKKTTSEFPEKPQVWRNDIDSVIMDAEDHAQEDYEKRAAITENSLGEDKDEFGIIVVHREGEMPPGWSWNRNWL